MTATGPANTFPPGSLVRAREREWVVLPSQDPDLLQLRPLGGGEGAGVGIYLPLGLDAVTPAAFPPPDPERAGDHTAGRLLRDAARLSFRSGAGPFRSLGRVSVRPRPYQLVPLLMALRLDPVRLLIADDVGIGKTIEAALIARELLDRGEARRLAVVCPPHLCDQWQQELAEKFHIDAVVVRSGTAARLERGLPPGDVSIFKHYTHMVVSVDYAKAERRRDLFALDCPDLVIVDEAHTCARPASQSAAQQQRHELLRLLAKRPGRHLLLLTATPHSGVEEAFQSLLGLLDQRYLQADFSTANAEDQVYLARQFVQRRRADVRHWMGEDTPFPHRDAQEAAYALSPEYRDLFDDVYKFAREIVRSSVTLSGFKQRVRYWTALALLRCVMSSPAAAMASLQARVDRLEGEAGEEPDDSLYRGYVYDLVEEEAANDVAPAHVVEEGEATLGTGERDKLRAITRKASGLKGEKDAKVIAAADQIAGMLEAGYNPIVFCRYIATADYVAEELNTRLGRRWKDCRIISVTGADPDDVRKTRVAELAQSPRRVLVATDCLSEGINLQEGFSAVLHYDLPWNPNRLEQRVGRVDRYGQPRDTVKSVLLYGRDNPIDGAVLDVLLRKAEAIRRTLGVAVHLPMDSESVVEAIVKSLLLHGAAPGIQLSLFDQSGLDVPELHRRMDQAAAREKESHTRFAQRGIKPGEVESELRETDAALGDARAVEAFVRAACQRLNASLTPALQPRQAAGAGGSAPPVPALPPVPPVPPVSPIPVWRLNPAALPPAVREQLPAREITLAFAQDRPAPEGVAVVGRNSPLTSALCDYVLETALDPAYPHPAAARCGVTRTNAVAKRTTLLLLRVRYLLKTAGEGAPLLAEEVVVRGFTGRPAPQGGAAAAQWLAVEWLAEEEALRLLETATPDANVAPTERLERLTESLAWLPGLTSQLDEIARQRALTLAGAHRRVRRLTRRGAESVTPQLPADVLGLYVLLPAPQGVLR